MKDYSEKIYAGVLGKILGVYLGRPVEGWTYEKIDSTFGEVYNFKNHKTGAPLIVPDDDISGTFVFYRALEDNGYDLELTARQIGDTWLNYVIEDKTILWWGGLSRSSEHTAYLRLKEGVEAPESGSVELNGESMAEQIGAQIFIDTWALVNPNNPERTADLARKAASVSHGGIAIEAAVFLAVMESLAFEENDIDRLIDEAVKYVKDDRLTVLIEEVRKVCAEADDWHEVREWIEKNHGYEKYAGSCPMVTNHLAVMMALLMGGDDYNKSIMIATSAGWDTDCNAGNVGCLNGIRLGLEGFGTGADLRKAVADRMYVVSADGGSCISDAVLETRKLIKACAALNGEEAKLPDKRYSFEYKGSVQGFVPYNNDMEDQVLTGIENAYEKYRQTGLVLSYEGLAKGTRAAACIDTFIDLKPKGKDGTSYFDVLCSPTLYGTQEVEAEIIGLYDENPDLRFFIDYFDENDELQSVFLDPAMIGKGRNVIRFTVPDTMGHPIYQLGMELTCSGRRMDGDIILKTLDWSDAPKNFRMGMAMELTPSLTPWTTTTAWMKMFMSSAKNFAPDYTTTISLSHPEKNGIVTLGTHDWKNYSVSSKITFSYQEGAGIVARSKGHNRYYGAILKDGKAMIVKKKDRDVIELGSEDFKYMAEDVHEIRFDLKDSSLTMYIDGKEFVKATDDEYKSGGAGVVVDRGCILADGLEIKRN
ncbi:ADP-ribosylglycohydrolase family protein [Anaerobium acetethylicum]|uniref:ADP-ribosylglycohydrolase n=1 Tax=Anaerobium acetethylicum TaxID=1619234 RepID=A0A1D3TTJ2_9FIRM|nr:ADP-ribosylglycohydrolase family protein [Anaerobium acetethylicum]SCP97248.1 ADP-ribosylglycohydrolase [Anaerobium acetethylicum]